MAFDHPMSLSQPAARPSPADQLRRSRVDSPDSFTTIRCRKCISTFVQTRASTSGLSSPTESVAPHLLAKTLRPILPWVLFPSKIPFFRWTPGVPGHTAKVRWLDSLGASAALLSPRQVLDSVGLAIRRVLIPPFVHRFAADASLAEAPSPPVSAPPFPPPRPRATIQDGCALSPECHLQESIRMGGCGITNSRSKLRLPPRSRVCRDSTARERGVWTGSSRRDTADLHGVIDVQRAFRAETRRPLFGRHRSSDCRDVLVQSPCQRWPTVERPFMTDQEGS